jgi:dinuclear metal center YbgI/SA1388 family protein
MTKIQDIITKLESIVPPSLQENWDNSGLLVGNPKTKVTSVLLSIDVTEDVIEEAVQKNANLIIAHHPIIFKGLNSITGKNYVERTVINAIKNDIAIYVLHTNLDVLPEGVSYKLAKELDLNQIKTLSPSGALLKKLIVFVPTDYANTVREAIFKAGAGHIGKYDQCSFNCEGSGTFRALDGTNPFVGKQGEVHLEKEVRIESIFPEHLQNNIIQELKKAHPYEEVAYDIYTIDQKNKDIGLGKYGNLPKPMNEKEFFKYIKNQLNIENFRHSPLTKKEIKTVAVCGGSGSFLIKKAKQKADVYITADVKYHEFFDAEKECVIIDIGHYESERYSKDIFYELITKNFSNFAVHFSDINTNPINYS